MSDTPPGGIFAGGVDQHHTRPFPPTLEQVDSRETNQHPPQQVRKAKAKYMYEKR